MAFERLDSIVSRVVGRVMNDVGAGDVGASPDAVKLAKSRKNAGTEAPASYREVTTVEKEATDEATQPGKAPASPAIGRKQRIAPGSPIPVAAGPMPAVRCFLVIEGGLSGAHVRRPRPSKQGLRVASSR